VNNNDFSKQLRQFTDGSNNNPLLSQVVDVFNQSEELHTLWQVANVTAVKRLGMTDHGSDHFMLVAKTALKMQRLMRNRKVKMSIQQDFRLSYDHAEVVVLLAALLHDVGMSIHRKGHEEFSLFLADRMVPELLEFLPIHERTIIKSEILHAIIGHRSDGNPLTIEAGIVRVADSLDMTRNRTKLKTGSKLDIHSVSALAIDEVELKAGTNKPILVNIVMNHTAGIFQVDELMKKKVMGSGIEQHLKIMVYMDKGKGKKLFKDFLSSS